MANVRFYRLEVLPNFDVSKQGIFVHVTKTMYKEKWPLSDGKEKDPSTIYMTLGKDGGNVGRINLVEWLSTRHIVEIASGLWFGGENGWELLSNETNSAAINAAIDAKINALNAGGFTQATIGANTTEGSESATGSTLTIKGIKEEKGIIKQDGNNDVNIAIDGGYNKDTNKIATQSTVTKAIEALDVNTAVQAVTTGPAQGNADNTVLTFNGIKEVDGKIVQGDDATTFTVGDAKLKIQIGSAEAGAFEVFSANKQSDSTIKLDGYVFKKDENNVISVIAQTPVSNTNPLVTKADINSLAGAMHYRGGVISLPTADENTKKGDVWIVTTAFVTPSDSYEVGDMFIARADGASATFDTVQGNLTLGTGSGQIAANSAALSKDKIVVASENGIETIDFDKTNLTDTTGKNERTLTYTNGLADGAFHHDLTIKDTFKVIGKDFTKFINITSNNRSIDIAANGNTGVMVDLVWNTSIE